MGNSSSSNETKELKVFQAELSRKMNVHLLSNKEEDCIRFIKIFTGIEIKKPSKELLEESINKKINLYSFMNYKIYTDTSKLINEIKTKVEYIKEDPEKNLIKFSEVIIILNNENIIEQINELKKNEYYMELESYYIPFLIIIYPEPNDDTKIDLKHFEPSKTFQYKITLDEINDYITKKNKELKEDLAEFSRKLNAIFSYYNELGDEFSFINSEGKETKIEIENNILNSVFFNILFIGRSSSGKSTLINLLLGEKKTLEGGSGFSTTSKDIIIFKKNSVPLKLYDVKGIEDEDTINNYVKILKDFNKNKKELNTIFYCKRFTEDDTIILKMEYKIFDELVCYDMPIIFVITKCPYAPQNNDANKEAPPEALRKERKKEEKKKK